MHLSRIALGPVLALLVLVGTGCGLVSTRVRTGQSGAVSPAPAAERLAADLAASLLDKAALPNGASVTTTIPAALAKPFDAGNPANRIDDFRLWTLPESADSTWRFTMARPSAEITTYGGGPNNGTFIAEGYVLRPPLQIDHEVLSLQIVDSGPGTSIMRADALVVWLPDRTPGEEVPVTDTVVTVGRSVSLPGQSSPHTAQVVTDTAWVRVLTEAFDGLPTALPVAMTCDTKDADARGRVAFSSAPTAVPDIVATLHPCSAGFLVTVQLRGAPAQPLKDIGGFYSNVSAIPPEE